MLVTIDTDDGAQCRRLADAVIKAMCTQGSEWEASRANEVRAHVREGLEKFAATSTGNLLESESCECWGWQGCTSPTCAGGGLVWRCCEHCSSPNEAGHEVPCPTCQEKQ